MNFKEIVKLLITYKNKYCIVRDTQDKTLLLKLCQELNITDTSVAINDEWYYLFFQHEYLSANSRRSGGHNDQIQILLSDITEEDNYELY